MEQLLLKSIARVDGEILLPGSKSLSNRILLLAALSRGVTEVYNLLDSDDTNRMAESLQRLGVSLELSQENTVCRVQGLGGPFPQQETELFLGNSGTTIRTICAALCLGEGDFTLTGDPRMYERPIKDLVDALRQLGAEIEYLAADGYPPLRIHAKGIPGGRVSIRGNVSSQYLTASLLSAPLARQDMVIDVEGDLVSKPYIDMTVAVMRRFGAAVEANGYRQFRVPGGPGIPVPRQRAGRGRRLVGHLLPGGGGHQGRHRAGQRRRVVQRSGRRANGRRSGADGRAGAPGRGLD